MWYNVCRIRNGRREMDLTKCPNCGSLTGHWNELCEECAGAYQEEEKMAGLEPIRLPQEVARGFLVTERGKTMTRSEVEAINATIMQLLDVLLSYIAEDHLAEWKHARSIIEATQFVELPGDQFYG